MEVGSPHVVSLGFTSVVVVTVTTFTVDVTAETDAGILSESDCLLVKRKVRNTAVVPVHKSDYNRVTGCKVRLC